MYRIGLPIAVCLLCSTLAAGADWPQWRGPARDGISQETGLLKEWPKGGPKLSWKINLGGVGYSSPVVAGKNVFVTAAEDDDKGLKEFLVCLNAEDGKQVWKVDLPNSDGNYNGGWGSGPRATPTLAGDFIYVLGARGDLFCLKAANGNKVWSVNLPKEFGGGIPFWGYSESVLIDGDRVVCTPGGKKGAILALDKATGKKLWQSADLTDAAAYSSIVIATTGGVKQYVTQTATAAVGVRATDGKLLWRKDDLKRAVAIIPTPIVAGNLIFFTSGYGAGCELIKLDASEDGTVKATTEYTQNLLITNHHGGVVQVGDHIYGHTDRGAKWFCYDFKKGGEEFVWESKALGKGSLTVADGMLFCLGEDPKKGTVVLTEANAEGWKETGRFDLPEKSQFPRKAGMIWAHPVVANGKLYIRDHELLFCYDVAAK